MKGTAVEWLEDEIRWYISNDEKLYDMFKKAKKMEKKQMKKAYNHERPNLLCYEKGTAFEEYYIKNYKIEEL
jgi:hypothetical protein